jgi:hypothetical protein
VRADLAEDLAEAAGRLADCADADEAEGLRLKTRGTAAGGRGGAAGDLARTACLAACQAVFLLGLPGSDSDAGGAAPA